MVLTNLSSIRAAMERRGLHPRKRFGQNFLKDRSVLRSVVDEADLGPGDLVLEIGSGPGSLTEEIAGAGARIVAVEIDKGLCNVARDLLGARKNIEWLQDDILEKKNRINPRVVDRVKSLMGEMKLPSFKVVANLPYNVATPVIVNILESDLPWGLMVVTVQDEVAERFVSEAGSRSYGLVTVLISLKAGIRRVRRIHPASFWPKPLVESSIVRFEPRSDSLLQGASYDDFKRVVQGIFAQRRKGWLKSLLSHLRIENKTFYREKFKDLGRRTDLRGEELTLREFVLLTREARELGLLGK